MLLFNELAHVIFFPNVNFFYILKLFHVPKYFPIRFVVGLEI
ncbi:sclerostin domain containing 1, isoform CRA_b [Rattus norvegicus]|uniref:Sclerostin domain containing 1, isoform CRA_b n=1 Tax=Rattus norvegicus TaxID=10116 RepID=A6HBB3_RAT|nr:sclerostin domain containing 1, isoform CRA_b [Rattus norvegicus]